MRGILFDENVPRRITFSPSAPFSHATDLGSSVSDSAIWEYAKQNRLAIVTKDTDFSHRIMLSTPPPWIVHLRFGNLPKREFHALLARLWPQIESLLPANKLISVFHDKIEAIAD
ncbi:hypothetical protein OPIT5_12570 [Opitutaceae bacterium TAV5]|nr:hypothetical protein OPIT5_12570 [Opitutaceae bacterium TAV5]